LQKQTTRQPCSGTGGAPEPGRAAEVTSPWREPGRRNCAGETTHPTFLRDPPERQAAGEGVACEFRATVPVLKPLTA
jgi:hypothetical protein